MKDKARRAWAWYRRQRLAVKVALPLGLLIVLAMAGGSTEPEPEAAPTTTTTLAPEPLLEAFCLGQLDAQWADLTAASADALLSDCLASTPDLPTEVLEAYCTPIDGAAADGLCMDDSTLDYRPILAERIERLSSDRASLLPAEVTP